MVSPTNMLGTSKFTLPKDWSVEKVPRKFRDTVDKYYRDPETGQYFRSLKEVERYITEGVTPTKSWTKKLKYRHDDKNSGSKAIDVAGVKLAIMSPTSISPATKFKLPDGWVVEEVPRETGHSADKYYYEPGTGQKFRSMLAVKKHLMDLEERSPLSVVLEEIRENKLPISKAFKLSTCIKNHGSYSSWKKSISRKEKISSLDSPPGKINGVINNAKHDASDSG